MITNLITYLSDALGAIDGIRKAADYPPTTQTVDPLIIIYPGTTTATTNTPGEAKYLFNMVVELHITLRSLPRDVEKTVSYLEPILNVLMSDPTFGGLVDTYDTITADFTPMTYGGVDTIGFRFSINGLKYRTPIT